MRSLIAPAFGPPSVYQVLESPDLVLTKPTEILVKITAASINGHDIIMASGKTKMIQVLPLPYPIGLDYAGFVMAVGAEVQGYAPGDAVYGFSLAGGCAATQILVDLARAHAIAKVPSILESPAAAASLPAVAVTAHLGLLRANTFFAETGGLAGKTVFIPGALSGVGSIALQLAKRVYGCRTLTAASPGKIPRLTELLGEGVVDVAVDYTTADVVKELGKSTVDFVFDTTGLAADYLPLIRRSGLCLSIARLPPGSTLRNEDPEAPPQSRVACIGQNVMDGMDTAFRTWARTRYGVTYIYQKTDVSDADMSALSELVQTSMLKPVVGKTASLDDIETIREVCMGMFSGKGGIGKFVITMP
ncbi:GroES-like protein [Amniculicola lignicola CBS 123094]|uniref:GroES-like protein n=1 Tax=Amniculicola lignicola CBS 123094 TaxID=1392246 RepID=A0A6A5X4G7_9PLEO|nr:GroES-like protein [Amniculicola lignicola CBS 123094]